MELDGLKPFPIDHGPWGENEDWTEQFRRVIGERLGGPSPHYHDIRFSLMAVVPDHRPLGLRNSLALLKCHREVLAEAFGKFVDSVMPEFLSQGEDADPSATDQMIQDFRQICQSDQTIKTEEEGEASNIAEGSEGEELSETNLENCHSRPFIDRLAAHASCGRSLEKVKAVLEILETEIDALEQRLRDEQEKRDRYKVDDCRRTHNYDQLIVTFLAAAAESGALADHLADHLQPNKRKHRPGDKATAKTPPTPNSCNKKRGRKRKTKTKRKR